MKKSGLFRYLLLVLVIAAALVKLSARFFVDYLWFKDLGFTKLFTVPIMAKLQIGVISFLVYFLIIFIAGLVAYRVFVSAEQESVKVKNRFHLYVLDNLAQPREEKDITPVNRKKVIFVLLGISVIISLFLALAATGSGWMKLLEFRNASGFGITEQVFNRDISFYVFRIPLYNFVLDSLIFPLALVFILSLMFFGFTGFVKLTGSILRGQTVFIPRSIRRFWAAMIGLLFILFGLKKYLAMFSVIYSQTGYVFGAGYTDVHVTVPLAKVMVILAFLCGIASFLYFFVNDHRLIAGAFAVYLAVAALGALAQGLVQYSVSNNEFVKEKPYIEQEIKFTRMAYNLNNIKVKDYPGTARVTRENIDRNRPTMENIRLNDPQPLKTVLSQNQGLRYYYRFNDIDIDRYWLDGKYRQVLLSPREISDEALTEKAGTFVNLTMRYTHGYGAAATLANEIDESGYARLILKDVPPKSTDGMKITEPRIYFGELTNDSKYGYVIGNTSAREFDYPQGDDNVENTYTGKTGLAFTGLNKLFLSAYFNTFRFYVAGEINENSKLLMKRNIVERVTTLMPYLKYDSDPYIVAASDGKLYWILDAYTATDKFPYSAPTGGLNYIRNSVKVVIDPFNGTVDFYTFDKNDPILKTVARIFPGVFRDASQLPANLAEHIRYPEDYFKIQSDVLLNFHVSNPSVFYNREDTWDIAKKVGEGGTGNIEPYYSVMRLPGEDETEFTLMLPFTPASRQGQHRNNLVSWLAARSDGKHYGELILYKVPKNTEIQGPLMIDSMIDQDTTISGKMTLWGQGGSQVIRGNLMTVPIDGGFVYVEPIYIRAEQQGASIPQMQAIIFAVDKKLIMVETKNLDKAVTEFFGREARAPQDSAPGTGPGTGANEGQPQDARTSLLKKIEAIKQQLAELEKAVQSMKTP